MNTFTKLDIQELLVSVFAPWVQDLGLQVIEINEDNILFYLPENDNLVRGGGDDDVTVVCGQAIASAGDTCSVLALTAFNKKFRNCTTVDMTTHFLRPLMNKGIENPRVGGSNPPLGTIFINNINDLSERYAR